MPVTNFGKDLKRLVPVGNPHLMAGESTRIYHEIVFHALTTQYSFKKIKKSFELSSTGSEVNTLNSADASGVTVWSTNAGTHEIDVPILNPFSRVQVEDKLKKACLFFQRDVFSDWLNVNGFEEERFTWKFYFAAKALSSFNQCFI